MSPAGTPTPESTLPGTSSPGGRPLGGGLSYAQERMWLSHQLDPTGTEYNVCLALRLRGPLDVPALAGALGDVVARHQALRTVYPNVEGRPVASVLPPAPVELPVHPMASEEEVRRTAVAEARRPFDLAAGPVLRVQLARLAADDHVLVLAVHHIAFDEWSMGVFLGELDALYQARLADLPDPLPPLPAGYDEVVAAERAVDPAPALAYWRGALAGLPALDLPTDRIPAAKISAETSAETSTETSAQGETVTFTVPAATAAALGAVARRCRATPYMAGLAAFAALLSRHCGQDDIALGSTVANRAAPHSEHLVGAFFNTVVMRADLSGAPSFTELLRRVRAYCLDALTHQHLPYPMLAQGRAPLFRVLYELHAGLSGTTKLGDLGVEPFEFPDTAAKYDLALSLMPEGDHLLGHLTYRVDLFEPGTARRLAESFVHLLTQVAAAPDVPLSALEILPPAEREALLAACRGPEPLGSPEVCAHELFERQARLTPQAVALTFGGTRLSYRELNARANRIAHWLRGRGMGPESIVAVRLRRSDWLVAAFLGIWKAGAAYLPLDPGLPAARLEYMLADSGARLVLDDAGALEAETAGCPSGDPDPTAASGNLAYLIYTSGSTGRPKGVMVPHRGLVNFLRWCVSAYAVGGVGGAPLFSSVAYDMVVPNIYTPLVVGQCLHVAAEDTALDELGTALSARPYGFVKLTPGHLEVLAGQLSAEQAAGLAGVLVVGADAFPSRALAFWQALDPAPVLLNEYGPTEASVANCVHTVTGPIGGELVPIGRPIPGTAMYVLDETMRPLPMGVPGELYIGGECVVRGYHGRPALTAERFLPDPFGPPGSRLYRTGDLGRLRADGEFEFLGRLDDQVKIRGFRVELGEVEAALDELPGVDQSVVIAAPVPEPRPGTVPVPEPRPGSGTVPVPEPRPGPGTVPVPEPRPGSGGGRRLVAYVVGTATAAEMRAGLARSLPEYMVPSVFVPLPAIPLNRNGKVDRSALPEVNAATARDAEEEPAPRRARTAVEGQIADLIAGLLGIGSDDVGADEDLFARGIDSLGAVRLMASVEQRLGVKVKLRRFLANATVSGLATLVSTALPDRGPERTSAVPLPVITPLVVSASGGDPLYCFHPLGGSALCYAGLAARLAAHRPVYALQALESGVNAGSLPSMAARYAAELAESGLDLARPYTLAGWSAGGVLAFETARRLQALGHHVDHVVLIDSVLPEVFVTDLLGELAELEALIDRLAPLGVAEARQALLDSKVGFFAGLGMTSSQVAAYHEAYGPELLGLWRDSLRGLADYRAGWFHGRVTLLVSESHPPALRAVQEAGWRQTVSELTVHEVPGEHHELLRAPHVNLISRFLTP
ncbi:amino acid adenylation domain-containing protein [Streptosporangium sp. NBC_01755]|uniref:amino acid adenylation domain-containing protein n=1 Tax=unclassified Streptosporangium TaxID=2632669 RepID=UPI002DDA2922|nr:MULTISPECIES: amino acid adenylation domain-containing protein [unclassified Streptosporangium]WSA28345.1 amino acid adenylation domain-containing protein [Streptosporangium sp. NBC_01810]WSD00177.1 amino acid adenylation domain-containing protein [Streptosporangium sp. NBC_01755]